MKGLREFTKDRRNLWTLAIAGFGVLIAGLSVLMLPEVVGTQLYLGILKNTMKKTSVVSANLLLTLCAAYMYQRNGYMLRLLILALMGDIVALVIFILNLIIPCSL
jgi:hypothetical protein